ncbi:hypothetical protein ADUPG1_009921 [Aduncisulcus paluster]|uniref:non-specific serine/threonine protein kinase n=1 Tax=Aduncisulcus paluster TaxID=2918883 RepID=A0ABQ5KZE8_9EUKA|nr:hypothetical protein ADUPG1_009921 [Aduncisulcus paluster]
MKYYTKLQVIGRGSFGEVHRARLNHTGQLVALKYISRSGKTKEELKTLEREILILRKLQHPFIVRQLDSFETADDIVVVTELAQGDLSQILKYDRTIEESEIRLIAYQLVQALSYLHARRVIHRDLKPSNVLVFENRRIKVADFGFARVLSPATLFLTSIKGTPLYMAPEVLTTHRTDTRSDLWSLGCLLYELAVGRPPYVAGTIFALTNKLQRCRPEFPSTISSSLRSILEGLLVPTAEERMTLDQLMQSEFIGNVPLLVSSTALSHRLSSSSEKVPKTHVISSPASKRPGVSASESITSFDGFSLVDDYVDWYEALLQDRKDISSRTHREEEEEEEKKHRKEEEKRRKEEEAEEERRRKEEEEERRRKEEEERRRKEEEEEEEKRKKKEEELKEKRRIEEEEERRRKEEEERIRKEKEEKERKRKEEEEEEGKN